MRPRLQPLASLYFRWGRAAGLESHEVAKALVRSGLIELVEPEHWREVRSGEKLSREAYESLIFKTLETFKKDGNR